MKFLFPFLFCVSIFACQNNQPIVRDEKQAAAIDLFSFLDTTLKNGDLLLRSDDDIVGLTLRNMNDSDKTFSHSGLAFKEDSGWYVYNMMAGEENPTMEMKREPLRNYLDPKNKSGFGLYRYNLSSNEIDKLHQITKQEFQQHLLFDSSFNLADDSAMYCSEMIAKNLQRATAGRIQIPTTYKENFSFKATIRGRKTKQNLRYIAIDNLYLNGSCKKIISEKFPQQ